MGRIDLSVADRILREELMPVYLTQMRALRDSPLRRVMGLPAVPPEPEGLTDGELLDWYLAVYGADGADE